MFLNMKSLKSDPRKHVSKSFTWNGGTMEMRDQRWWENIADSFLFPPMAEKVEEQSLHLILN